METMIVLIVAGLAAAYLIRRFYKNARSREAGCGCGGQCSSCCAAPPEHRPASERPGTQG
ncbi:MAG: FeoB-associated Cys-rich membrane protein [Proteobacteria bacterium]|nr:FeoB-associated Cys-rich membrane protein [Pseudomonadota bacterium]